MSAPTKRICRRLVFATGFFVFCHATFASDRAIEGESCGQPTAVLKPIYYSPSSENAALSGARGKKFKNAVIALTFRFVGSEPCTESNCVLEVLDNEGKRMIAKVLLARRDVRFCKFVNVVKIDPNETYPCSTHERVNTGVKIEVAGNSQRNLNHATIFIEYDYYISGPGENIASKCMPSGVLDNPAAAAIGQWDIKSSTGARTTITEIDFAAKRGSPGSLSPFLVEAFHFNP